MEYEDLLIDSSDDENVVMPPILNILLEDNNENNELVHLPVYGLVGRVGRIQHIKVVNYIENIVRNYIARDFLMHFRLSRAVAYELINQFEVSDIFIEISNHAGNLKITAEKHILCYLWFVGHESASYRDVADRFGVTISCLHTIITRVTQFIMTLAPNVIRYPTAVEKEESATYFLQEKGFPGVIGAIDGSHIRIDKPMEDPDSYINRKSYFSIHMQGTVNHKMKFIDVFIGYPGSVHDARVLKNSTIYADLRQLCGDNYILLGDSAYPCLSQLIVPYKDNGHLTRRQRTFNQKLSSSRVIIENAFGCLKQRFRQLYHFKLRDIVRMVHVIHACCVLHNIANAQDLQFFEDAIDDQGPDIAAQNQQVIDNLPREYETNTQKRDEICLQITRG
ncbi:putative nuclease HARBI1 isoform X1 [Temnothorax curvispinosus]|uniref:Nuclease HARBI1 isoform X1 n=1 Tax=Temnothorax curvispinosus TaxID=300111 RepID=A0A6J1Q2F7_9HYME|nr:putative nuclease HARBI1 isoform X1 [Temnothorax curvispinosus]XP_024891334.1 putative nuclease HARBI1 isoform X1 [Temnothorax curvispinosus]